MGINDVKSAVRQARLVLADAVVQARSQVEIRALVAEAPGLVDASVRATIALAEGLLTGRAIGAPAPVDHLHDGRQEGLVEMTMAWAGEQAG